MSDLSLSAVPAHPRRDRAALAGWALSGLVSAFLLGASALPKLAGMPVAAETMAALGLPDAPLLRIGLLEAGLAVLLLWPRTAPLAAVLATGLLGGAMVTQMRADMPLLTHVLFSVYLGGAMWVGLLLRDWRLRALLPWSRTAASD